MRNKLNNELAVCGFAAVKKLEKKDSSRIKRLYFNQENAPLFGGLCKKIAERKGIYNLVKNSEELEKLSFIDVPYAILKRVVVKRTCSETHQIWVEKDEKLMLTSS